MTDLYTFPDGFAETMRGPEIRLAYSTLPEEVHNMVGWMLEAEGDGGLPVWHSRIDSPVLAIQALKTNVGRTLPTYDHVAFPNMEPTGETRTITDDDLFAIAEGPTRTAHSYPVFQTRLERVTREALEESSEPRFLHSLFIMMAGAR